MLMLNGNTMHRDLYMKEFINELYSESIYNPGNFTYTSEVNQRYILTDIYYNTDNYRYYIKVMLNKETFRYLYTLSIYSEIDNQYVISEFRLNDKYYDKFREIDKNLYQYNIMFFYIHNDHIYTREYD